MHSSALTIQSSKSTATATAVVMAGAITVVEATTMDGVEAIIMVITIGETSLSLMLKLFWERPPLGGFFFGRNSWRPLRRAMSPVVQVFGRRNDETFGGLSWPASKKRQGTKSREVGHRRGSGRYGD
jgi:hypothetical protein